MDGVLWAGSKVIQSGVNAVRLLIQNQKKVYFLTNNSSKARSNYMDILQGLGIEVPITSIYSSSYLVAVYLKQHGCKKAFNLGMNGISEELKKANIQVVESLDLAENISISADAFIEMKIDETIDSVVTGFNSLFNYRMLCYASLCVQNKAKFVAANPDSNINVGTKLQPAGGCIQVILEKATGVKSVVVGKPSRVALDLIKSDHNLHDQRIVMIGDNIETDIAFGIQSGIDTVLVLTGVTSKEMSINANSTYVCEEL